MKTNSFVLLHFMTAANGFVPWSTTEKIDAFSVDLCRIGWRRGVVQRFSTFVTQWTPQKFQARMADPTAQGAPASTFRTSGWARTCLIKIAYPNDIA